MKLIIDGELTDLNTYINAERSNRFLAAKIKENDTLYVRAQCYVYKLKPIKSPVRIVYAWYCKDKKKDKSNIAFAKKFIEDGLVKAGILKNDGWNDIASYRDEFYVDKERPRIEVEITPL